MRMALLERHAYLHFIGIAYWQAFFSRYIEQMVYALHVQLASNAHIPAHKDKRQAFQGIDSKPTHMRTYTLHVPS